MKCPNNLFWLNLSDQNIISNGMCVISSECIGVAFYDKTVKMRTCGVACPNNSCKYLIK